MIHVTNTRLLKGLEPPAGAFARLGKANKSRGWADPQLRFPPTGSRGTTSPRPETDPPSRFLWLHKTVTFSNGPIQTRRINQLIIFDFSLWRVSRIFFPCCVDHMARKPGRMTTSQQPHKPYSGYSNLQDEWSEMLSERLQQTLAWLRKWSKPRGEIDKAGVEPADNHLWAEGPLPGGLVERLSHGTPARKTKRRPIANDKGSKAK